jgi:serine/threonine-protein kinase HipA
MARRPTHEPLNVYLNARLVGRLRRETGGAIDFTYEPSWLAWENTMPVSLSLPLRESRYVGEPVVAVFDNLLPDSESLRRSIAERVLADGTDAFSLLTALGHDCVGALQFLPDGQEPGPAGVVAGKPVNANEIARLLGDLAAAPLGVGEDEDFRISIAGAQEKTALLYWKNAWHKPSGTAATTHILKPQIGRLPNGTDLSYSVENEYFCMKLTAALGLPTANVKMEDFGSKRALIVERFDRLWTRDNRLLRVPQEDCCQALSIPPARKYEVDGGPGPKDILALLRGSDEPDSDRIAFLRALIVFWLLGATDGHGKNFSIFLSPGARFRMTPLYDVLSVQPSVDANQIRLNQMKLAMAVGDNRHYVVHTIVPRHFLQTAAKSGIGPSVVKPLFGELLEKAPPAIEKVLNELPAGFPDQIADSITGGFQERLRRLEQPASTATSRS